LGVALVALRKKVNPDILYSARMSFPISEQPDSQKILIAATTTLKDLLAQIEKEALPLIHNRSGVFAAVKNVICIFASPWYLSQTKTVRTKWDAPTVFAKHFVDEALAKEQQAFQASIAHSDYAEKFDKELSVAEQKVIQVRLNGYPTGDPYGKKAMDADISFFSSFLSKPIVEKFSDILSHAFHKETFIYHTFSFVSYKMVTRLFPDAQNFLLMDIAGEVSDLSLVKNGALAEAVSFPSGKNFLIRKIIKKLNVTPEIALSYLRMRGDKKMEAKLSSGVEEAINDVREEWLAYFKEAINSIVPSGIATRKMFVTVDGDVASIFTDFLGRFSMPLSPIVLDETYFGHTMTLHPKVTPDPFLSLEAMFLHNFASQGLN
jgi:hypothetical protein